MNFDQLLHMALTPSGKVMKEAEDDTYTLDDSQLSDPTPAGNPDNNTPETSDTLGDNNPDNPDNTPDEEPTTSEDDGYGLDDTEEDTQDETGDTGTETGNEADNLAPPAEPAPPGEVIPISQSARAILAYKNFNKYMELVADTTQMINELSAYNTTSDQVRDIISRALVSATTLKSKLKDYMTYKYSTNSYEVNYKNYMNFVIERRLVEELIQQVNKQTFTEV